MNAKRAIDLLHYSISGEAMKDLYSVAIEDDKLSKSIAGNWNHLLPKAKKDVMYQCNQGCFVMNQRQGTSAES
jgi:hypothetical protein